MVAAVVLDPCIRIANKEGNPCLSVCMPGDNGAAAATAAAEACAAEIGC